MRLTIKDIAKQCNISVSTVSRALNGDYGVKEKTRKIVLEAAKELGYVPNYTARELVSKKSNLIGIVLSDCNDEARPSFFEMFPAINKTLAAHHYRIIICTINEREYEMGDLPNLIKMHNLCGCILLNVFKADHPIYQDVRTMMDPIVVIEHTIQTKNCSNINVDEILGAYMATKYLIDCGHKKIGFVSGPLRYEISMERLQGFQQAMKESHLDVLDRQIVHSNYSGSGGTKSVNQLREECPELTAIFFSNDLMAMGAISSLAEAGIRVPRDLSVIGFDGKFFGKYYNPPLATIEVDNPLIGITIAEMLLDLISGNEGKTVRTPPNLYKGNSVKEVILQND